MPTYIVQIAHRVIEAGEAWIEAPNKRAALAIAKNMDLGGVGSWSFSDNDGPHWVCGVQSEEGECLDPDDEEDVEGATASPEEAVEE